jgi:ABC-type multidrug transport system fused ATPase/permease subunit
MVLAEIGSGDLFWSLLEFFFLFILIMILFQVIGDLFRDSSMSGGVKALWIVFLVLLPPLAILVYLITRGSGMQQRAIEQRQAFQAQMAEYVQTTAGPAGGSTPVEQIASAKALLDAGTISAAEFDALKAKALA